MRTTALRIALVLVPLLVAACSEDPAGPEEAVAPPIDRPAADEPTAPDRPTFFAGDLEANAYYGSRTVDDLRAQVEAAPDDPILLARLASELLQVGDHDEAYELCLRARAAGQADPPYEGFEAFIAWRLALTALRKAEVENCVARHFPESCIFPLRDRAVHVTRTGAERAREHLLELLAAPDLDRRARWRSRWLLNVVATALDDWPEAVPVEDRLPYDPFQATGDVGAFVNVAGQIGLEGGFVSDGSIVADDFDGDGAIDVIACGWLPTARMGYWRNDGTGRFESALAGSGLEDQRGGVDLQQADFDNDGDLDLLVVRGGQPDPEETPAADDGRLARVSLLANRGDGTFVDATAATGLADRFAPWSCAAWADFDGDGAVDLYLGTQSDDVRFTDQLLRNRGDGTFESVGPREGLLNGRHAMAAVWGDIDDDGRPDLFVANYGSLDRLYHNRGDHFVDIATNLGLAGRSRSHGAWFLDADDDGRFDLLVTDYGAAPGEGAADLFGQPIGGPRPRLLLHRGSAGFVDHTAEYGLDRVYLSWSGNVGDLDGDGRTDIYIGTGALGFEALFPNVLLRSAGGSFEDVTVAAGVGHLQKAAAVALADLDGDGAPEILVRGGGCYPADGFPNVVFRNPGHGNRWLTARLEGRRSNRSAILARLSVTVVDAEGARRTIRHVVGNGGSHGASTLRAELGLGRAVAIEAVEVAWPGGDVESFADVPLDASIVLIEGSGVVEAR